MGGDAGQHAADIGDVAIEMARPVADDGIKLGPVAGVGRHVAPNPHGAMAMRQPDAVCSPVTRRLPAGNPAGLGIAVGKGRRREDEAIGAALIFGRQRRCAHALFAHIGRLAHRLAAGGWPGGPLDHIILLDAHDSAIIEPAGLHQRLDGRHVGRREGGGQLDHHAAGGGVHHHDVVRIDGQPVTGRRGGDGGIGAGGSEGGRRRR